MGWFNKVFHKRYPEYVCGKCGASEENSSGLCINGHDYWVSLEDLDNSELWDYVNKADITRSDLCKLLGR